MNTAANIVTETITETEGEVAEEQKDMVQLAQEQRRFHKKVADAEDKLIENDNAVEAAKEVVRKAEKLEDVQAAVKKWAQVDRSHERLIEQRDNYRAMLAGVTKKMQEVLSE